MPDLKPSPYNPRRISDEQLGRLRQAMEEFGDLSGIVRNVRSGRLVGGHQRVKNLDSKWPIVSSPFSDAQGTVSLGWVDTPWGRWTYREVDWDEAREKAANIAANKHGGEFDNEKLSALLDDLAETEFSVDLLGFDLEEVAQLSKLVGNVPIELPAGDITETNPLVRKTIFFPKEQAQKVVKEVAALLKEYGGMIIS